MAAMSVATRSASVALDFFIGILLVDTTAIAQQAVYALGNCFFIEVKPEKCPVFRTSLSYRNVLKIEHLLGYEPLTKSEAWEEQAKPLSKYWKLTTLAKIKWLL